MGLELAQETLSSLENALTDFKGQAVKAAATCAVGIVKSVVTMKVDSTLIDGLGKGLTAGFSYFKQVCAFVLDLDTS